MKLLTFFSCTYSLCNFLYLVGLVRLKELTLDHFTVLCLHRTKFLQFVPDFHHEAMSSSKYRTEHVVKSELDSVIRTLYTHLSWKTALLLSHFLNVTSSVPIIQPQTGSVLSSRAG